MLMVDLSVDARKALDGICGKLADRLVDIDPNVSRLAMLRHLREDVERTISTEITLMRARDNPTSWRRVGEDLGTSAQAAHHRYGRRNG
jgi:hypothetical protein